MLPSSSLLKCPLADERITQSPIFPCRWYACGCASTRARTLISLLLHVTAWEGYVVRIVLYTSPANFPSFPCRVILFPLHGSYFSSACARVHLHCVPITHQACNDEGQCPRPLLLSFPPPVARLLYPHTRPSSTLASIVSFPGCAAGTLPSPTYMSAYVARMSVGRAECSGAIWCHPVFWHALQL